MCRYNIWGVKQYIFITDCIRSDKSSKLGGELVAPALGPDDRQSEIQNV